MLQTIDSTQGGTVPTDETKFDSAPRVRKAIPPDYSPEARARDVLRLALEEGAAMIALNARSLPLEPGPDPLHQLRVGLRRVRASLWAGRLVFDADRLRALGVAARDLGRVISTARSLDVFRIDTLPRYYAAVAEKMGDTKPLEALSARLARAAKAHAKTARGPEAMLDAATLSLDLGIEARRLCADVDHAALNKPAAAWAEKTLAKAAKRVFAHPDAFEAMSIEARHELRKDAKRLRYALDAFRPLFEPEAIEPMRRSVRRLGNALGSLNDSAEAVLIGAHAPERKYAKTIAAIIETADAEAEADAPKAAERWRVLQETPRFWRDRAARLNR